MSDARTGGDSPTRPGKNAVDAPSTGDNPANRGSKNGSAKHRRRRRAKTEPGVQAKQTNPQSSTGEDQSNPLNGGTDSKRSKRRRRRRSRGGQSTGGDNGGYGNVGGTIEVHSGNNGPSDQLNMPRADRNRPAETKINVTPVAAVVADSSGRKRRWRRSRRPGAKKRDAENLLPPHLRPDSEAAMVGKPAFRVNQENAQAKRRSTNSQQSAKPTEQLASDAYAALDLGTNNCRLLVAVPQQPGRFRVIDAFSRIVRLGEGLAATGELKQEAMDRAVGALKVCAGKLENRPVRGVRLIATEACRRAVNGEEFLKRVEREAGLKLEIVDRETEARLAVAGCASLIDRSSKGVVLFDIGGGSSELALLDLRDQKGFDVSNAMRSWTSLPLGVVTLSEKHGGGKHVTRDVFNAMVAEVSDMLSRFEGRDALRDAGKEGEIHLLGTSGTVTTLAGIHLKLPRYNRRLVDGIWMASADVEDMIEALIDMSFDQRVENPCIGHDRADLVLAGCAILVAIQQLWPCPRLRVADRGLREGLLTEMMNSDNAWQRRPRRFGPGRR